MQPKSTRSRSLLVMGTVILFVKIANIGIFSSFLSFTKIKSKRLDFNHKMTNLFLLCHFHYLNKTKTICNRLVEIFQADQHSQVHSIQTTASCVNENLTWLSD